MNYWQWPEVVDSDVSEELNIPAEKYEGGNPIASYTPRIKAGTAMEWDGTEAQYPFDVSDGSGVSSGVYDLRGHLMEKKRQCIGRVCLLSQIISKASLKTTGTGATLAQPTYNDWYERPESTGHGSSGGDDGTDSDWYFGAVNPIEVASVDDPAARSATIAQGLNAGTRYALKVSPVFSEGTPVDSDYVPIRIAAAALDAPQFVAITSVPKNATAPSVKEDCFRECALGRNYLFVQGSATVTGLKAYSSHVSILPDSKISVESVPNHAGQFLVSIDGSDIPALGGRQRLLLTLVGSNEQGAKV